MQFFDSHAHYWDDRFQNETEKGVDALLDTLFRENVCAIVNVGTSIDTSLAAIAQAVRYPNMYVAAGIHPGDCETLALDDTMIALRALLADPQNKIKALGEIGLDYHYLPFDKDKQKAFFHAQMELAREVALPVVIHDREAHGDCFETVLAHPDVRGVFHSYSGSAEMAKELVKRDYMISFSGTVSFKNARVIKEVAKILPKDKVMIETDAPYLTPHPHRGKMNHSGYLTYTCAALSELWDMPCEEVARITAQNAARFFDVKI